MPAFNRCLLECTSPTTPFVTSVRIRVSTYSLDSLPFHCAEHTCEGMCGTTKGIGPFTP
jgi:hypothetical protein